MKGLIYIITLLSFIFCNREHRIVPKKEVSIKSISQSFKSRDSLIYEIKEKGNVESFNELYYELMDSDEISRTDSIMHYSIIMAEKYNYDNAYYYYLEAILRKKKIEIDYNNFYKLNLSKLDSTSKLEISKWIIKMKKNKIITSSQYDSIKWN